jgi:hypothetical protein
MLLKGGNFVMHLSHSDQFLTYSVKPQKLSELRNISGLESMLSAYKIKKRHQMAELEETECLQNILTRFYGVTIDGGLDW